MKQNAKVQRLDVSKMSDEDIEDLFSTAYEEQIGKFNGLSEFEAKVSRAVGKQALEVEVTIAGLAGTPTLDDYKKDKKSGLRKVAISREGRGSLEFRLVPERTVALNSNDYVVTYQSI